MDVDLLNFGFKANEDSIIKVLGVGGGGGNAVQYMHSRGIAGVDFMVCNTDIQALQYSNVPVKLPLGISLTEGRGAGNNPIQGEQAAIENLHEIRQVLQKSTKMLFLTAGMGGGTGTGATPVIANLAKEMGILTIAVLTLPSPIEGKKRYDQAIEGVRRVEKIVDSLLVISNEKLHAFYGDLPASQAFIQADNIVYTAVKGCAEIITLHGNINIDFADVETVMKNSGVFLMGTGFADGENRAMRSVKQALESPLLDSNNLFGTKNILVNFVSGKEEIRMGEIGEITSYLQDQAGQEANIIWGNGFDNTLETAIGVTVIATGFSENPNQILRDKNKIKSVHLTDERVDNQNLSQQAQSTRHTTNFVPEKEKQQERRIDQSLPKERIYFDPNEEMEKHPLHHKAKQQETTSRNSETFDHREEIDLQEVEEVLQEKQKSGQNNKGKSNSSISNFFKKIGDFLDE